MYEIYESASCTLVWLGNAADDSPYAISALNFIGANVVCNHHTGTIEYRNESLRAIKEMKFPEREMHLSRLYRAVLALVRRDWFSRLWVLQEVIASQKTVAVCGPVSIARDNLLNACIWLCYSTAGPGHGQFSLKEVIPKIESFLYSASNFDFFCLQTIATQHDCEDPRDRVYSLRGLAEKSDVKSLLVKVDYDIPFKQLFKIVTLKEIENTERLDCLVHWRVPSSSSAISTHTKPSWLAGWMHAFGSGTTYHPSFRSAADSVARCNVAILPGDILRASGLSISAVEKVVQMSNVDDASPADRTRELCDLWATLRPNGCTDDDPNDLFCQMLISALPSFKSSVYDTTRWDLGVFRLLLRQLNSMDNEELRKFHTPQVNDPQVDTGNLGAVKFILAQLEGLSVFVLCDGSFGIGSFGTRVGDEIVVLLGCRMPMVLRSASLSPVSGFEIVGPAYVYDLRDGKALLGPLPSHVSYMPRAADNSDVHGYEDLRSGDVIFDPRIQIEDLEIGIRDGEMRYLGPDRQYFLKHGVPLEDFDLI